MTLYEYLKAHPGAAIADVQAQFPESDSWTIRAARREILTKEPDASAPDVDLTGLSKRGQNLLRAGFFRSIQITLTERAPVKPLWKRAAEQHLIISDLHAPEHDPHAFDAMLQVSQSLELDGLIVAGDGFDVGALSSHLPIADRPFRWVDERQEAIKPLIALREHHPDLPIRYLIGNHEDRADRFLASEAPQLQGLFSLPQILGIDDLDFIFPDDNRVLLANDQLLVMHGNKVRGESGQSVAAEVRDAGMSVLMGHVHRQSMVPVTKTVQTIAGKQPWVGVELGHLMNPRPSYIPIEKTANWQQGCALVSVFPNGRYGIELIPIFEGQAFFRGRVFTSRLKRS